MNLSFLNKPEKEKPPKYKTPFILGWAYMMALYLISLGLSVIASYFITYDFGTLLAIFMLVMLIVGMQKSLLEFWIEKLPPAFREKHRIEKFPADEHLRKNRKELTGLSGLFNIIILGGVLGLGLAMYLAECATLYIAPPWFSSGESCFSHEKLYIFYGGFIFGIFIWSFVTIGAAIASLENKTLRIFLIVLFFVTIIIDLTTYHFIESFFIHTTIYLFMVVSN
jgi:hypothetical protein